MNVRLLGAALAASLSLCGLGAAEAATFEPIAKGRSLVMTGVVEIGDVERLAHAAQASCDRRGYCPERIFLNSPGGQVQAGVAVAEYIRNWGIDTVVGPTDECSSICVAIFAAGSRKVVFPTSMIGVHSASWRNPYTGEPEGEAFETTVLIARYMKALGTPDAVIAKMIATPAADIAWLGSSDWPGVEVITEDAGYITPNEPHEPSTTSMMCSGENGTYVVSWTGAGMQVRDRVYTVEELHQNAKTGAWVATGPTRFGTYQAVFGGPNPRMVFWNGEESVTDNCW